MQKGVDAALGPGAHTLDQAPGSGLDARLGLGCHIELAKQRRHAVSFVGTVVGIDLAPQRVGLQWGCPGTHGLVLA